MTMTKEVRPYKMDNNTKKVIKFFEQICKVPRSSGNETSIREFMVNWANENNFKNQVDETGNVLISIPATKGMENKPVIVLQGHLDMVCEKTPDSNHDFTQDPIKTIVEGEWMRAENTTLGADDGIAMAISMALVKDSSVKHPKLELLFTIDEERGLVGAKGLKENSLSGKYLINLDSQKDGIFSIGCAGLKNTHIVLDLEYNEVPDNYIPYMIKITGCTGGHSGENIQCERANAIKVLARVLQKLEEVTDIRIINYCGGTAHNTIPRDCTATFFSPCADKGNIANLVCELDRIIKSEFVETDPNIELILDENFEPADRRAMGSELSLKILDLIRAVPHGVASKIKKLNLTETSSNFAIAKIEKGQLFMQTSQRSSVASRLDAITYRIESVGRLAGAHVCSDSGYMPWQPNFNSNLLKQSQDIYKKLFKTEPKIEITHVVVECGIIGSKYPDMEMISIGPEALDIHSPSERLNLPSVGKTYEFVSALLANLN